MSQEWLDIQSFFADREILSAISDLSIAIKQEFAGVEDRLTHELRNFLRRRGIRFAPFAWDADYRKGL